MSSSAFPLAASNRVIHTRDLSLCMTRYRCYISILSLLYLRGTLQYCLLFSPSSSPHFLRPRDVFGKITQASKLRLHISSTLMEAGSLKPLGRTATTPTSLAGTPCAQLTAGIGLDGATGRDGIGSRTAVAHAALLWLLPLFSRTLS